MIRLLVLTKRQYMNKDLLDDRFGRFREIPLSLGKNGLQVRGLCLSYRKRSEGVIQDGPVLWESLNAGRLLLPGLVRYVAAAARRARRADVIWACSDSIYGIIGCALASLFRIPVVFDIYDNFDTFFIARLPLAGALYHWAIRKSDAITCLSRPFAAMLAAARGRTEHVYPIEFAVDRERFRTMDRIDCRKRLGLPTDATLIGTAGALYENRDIGSLFGAFAELSERRSDLHLVLAGPLDNHTKVPARGCVHYLGELPFDTMPVLFNALDVAVVCYADNALGRYCFPQKTREMMACRVPVVAADVGGLRDILADRPHWRYRPGSARDLARVIGARLADRNTDYGPLPSWDDLADRLADVIHEVLPPSRPPRSKSEIRNPNIETRPNDQNTKLRNDTRIRRQYL